MTKPQERINRILIGPIQILRSFKWRREVLSIVVALTTVNGVNRLLYFARGVSRKNGDIAQEVATRLAISADLSLAIGVAAALICFGRSVPFFRGLQLCLALAVAGGWASSYYIDNAPGWNWTDIGGNSAPWGLVLRTGLLFASVVMILSLTNLAVIRKPLSAVLFFLAYTIFAGALHGIEQPYYGLCIVNKCYWMNSDLAQEVRTNVLILTFLLMLFRFNYCSIRLTNRVDCDPPNICRSARDTSVSRENSS